MKLKRQLYRARAADLIQRIEAAVRAAGAEAVRQRLGRVAKLRTRQVANGWAEVWVVEDVEELASEAELHSLSEMKLTLEGDVRLRRCEGIGPLSGELGATIGKPVVSAQNRPSIGVV